MLVSREVVSRPYYTFKAARRAPAYSPFSLKQIFEIRSASSYELPVKVETIDIFQYSNQHIAERYPKLGNISEPLDNVPCTLHHVALQL
jgi:hypothetical protein